MRLTGRFATGIVTALLVSGCTAAADPASSPTAVDAPGVTLTRALEATRDADSAEITVELLTTVDDVDDAISGQGTVALTGMSGQMQWTSSAGVSIERRTSDGVFVQLDPPAGSWRRAPAGTPTSGTMDPLRGLDELTDVQRSGIEQLSTGEAERFIGSLPADPYVDAMGLNPTAAEAVAADEQASIDVTVWVDRDGRVRRVMRTLRTSLSIAAATFTDLVEFGAAIDVRTPRNYETAT